MYPNSTLEANATITIDDIVSDENFDLFSFPYSLYDESLKLNFEIKFIEHFRFREIGLETVGRFQQRLMSRLNTIMPYYEQLYQTELLSKDINFLLNLDRYDTTKRELIGESLRTTTGNTLSKSKMDSISNTSSNHIESMLANGNADLNDPTGKSQDGLNTSGNDVSENTSTNDDTSKGNSKDNETITNRAYGNIGTTSSGSLLEDWRKILINIDMQIFEECNDLFYGLFC